MDIADPELWRGTADRCGADLKFRGTEGPSERKITRLEHPPVVLLGAGASMPNLPVAAKLKRELLRLVVQVADADYEDLDSLFARISQPHITLEVFFSMLGYRCAPAFRPIELWTELCRDIPVNQLSQSIALLRQAGLIGTILTTNFDEMLPRALESVGEREGHGFRIVTEWQLEEATAAEPTRIDLCPLHGTIYRADEGILAPPITATARGLVRPFPPTLRNYLGNIFHSGQKVLVIGYSGQDHYDMNPFLDDLRRTERNVFRNWLWVSHTADEGELRRIRRIVGGEHIAVADATRMLSSFCASLGLRSVISKPANQSAAEDADRRIWVDNLARAFKNLQLPRSGAQEFITDLHRNLPGTWVVLEHYRLFSAGYDEGVTLTFGGVSQSGDDESGAVGGEHLIFLEPPWAIPFGELLQAQFRYWVEDREANRRLYAPDDVLYPRSAAILHDIKTRIQEVLDRAPQEQLRREDRALLLVGLAVAEDYLGLIERKRALRLPGSHREHWVNARQHFEKCRLRALEAGEALTGTTDRPTQARLSTAFADDLIQHRLWTLIGQANVARTLDDRESAITALLKVIKHMQEMIEHERERAVTSPERGMHDDYLIALYPQLWLRASEMLKIILNCEGDTAVPDSWDRIDSGDQRLAEMALEVCERAYAEYTRRASSVNMLYPGRYEALILMHATRAMATQSLTAAERSAAFDEVRHQAEEFATLTQRYPEIRPDWVRNVLGRVAKLESAMAQDSPALGGHENASSCRSLDDVV